MIIVRTAAGQEVEGWRMRQSDIDGPHPLLLQPDGVSCRAGDFLLRGMRAAATTAAERTALERGGYLSRPPRRRTRAAVRS
jgi:hypothetical protein